MGLNTIHNKSRDLFTLYNVSKKQSFKCEILPATDCRKYEIALGLDFNQIKYSIKINGSNNIEIGDRIKFGDNIFEAVAINPVIDNLEQARYRSDITNFTGAVVINLE